MTTVSLIPGKPPAAARPRRGKAQTPLAWVDIGAEGVELGPDDQVVLVASARQLQQAGLELVVLRSSRKAAARAQSKVALGISPQAARVRIATVKDDPGVLAQALEVGWIHPHGPEHLQAVLQDFVTLIGEENAGAAAPGHTSAPSRFAELSTAELAALMQCTTTVVYEREKAGELFAILPPGRKAGRRYPAFQVDEQLDHELFKHVLQVFRSRGATNHQLWTFLRSANTEFDGRTPVDALLGEALAPDERDEAIMDVVLEELSRITA